ncbi:hypothetical protein BC834DRAFT_407294 [Gloeopeniophorella convolvens]|nr:hypothetical protein BC834DRAFT_407294 [Gloeopeniophorella convolvens]
MSSPVPDDVIDKMYPTPSTGSVALVGPSPQSTQAALNALRHDYEHHHTFHNEFGFHNHASHQILAVYGLGASADLIDQAYALQKNVQKPKPASPEGITDNNFLEHLGNPKFYAAYLKYFSNYLLDHTPTEAFQHFVLSPEFNYIPDLNAVNAQDVKNGGAGGKKQPEMLNRILAGLVHPFIHAAYGVEFGLPGQTAEGLAQAAVHPPHQTALVPYSLFQAPAGDVLGKIKAASSAEPAADKKINFSLLGRIRDDPAFSPATLGLVHGNGLGEYAAVLKGAGASVTVLIREWTEEWLKGAKDGAEIEKRLEGMLEEIIWSNVIWYGVRGWGARGDAGRVFNADFFTMHLVTSAIFLLTLIPPSAPGSPYPGLPLASRVLLLQSYATVSVAWYISRGNASAPLPIADFYAATEAQLAAPAATAAPSGTALKGRGDAWARIIPNTVAHPDEHLYKAIRSLVAFASRWGTRAPGHFANSTLEGAEHLDGTLFVRVAALTVENMGWALESAKLRDDFDRDGYF